MASARLPPVGNEINRSFAIARWYFVRIAHNFHQFLIRWVCWPIFSFEYATISVNSTYAVSSW